MFDHIKLSSEYFYAVFYSCGCLCVLISILYTFFLWKDFKVLTPKLPCYKSSQILFIIGSLARGLGYIVQATVTIIYPGVYDILYMCDPITIGLSSYLLTVAYLFLFYLWISICVNIISNDSTTGLRDRTKNIFNFLLIFILTLGFVLTGVLLLAFLQKSKYRDYVHEVEILIAIFRDFVTATIILIYSIIVFRKSDNSLCSICKESVYFWMLMNLVASLYIRSGTLVFLLYEIIKGIEGLSLANYINTLISAILAELLPFLMILITRKRSGLLSIYDSLN